MASGGCFQNQIRSDRRKFGDAEALAQDAFKPRAITIDEQDRLYIVDTTGRIQVFDTEGNFPSEDATDPEWSANRTRLRAGQKILLTKSSEVQHDPDGNDPRIFVADTHYYRMLSYTLKGEPVTDESIASPVAR